MHIILWRTYNSGYQLHTLKEKSVLIAISVIMINTLTDKKNNHSNNM